MPDKSERTLISKLFGTVVALGAAWVAQKLVASAWKAASGHLPPKAEDEDTAGLAEVAAAAAISGAVVALVRVLATRGAARTLR